MENDLKKVRDAGIKFASENVTALAAELIEWQDTSLLCNGKLRELASMLAPLGSESSLKIAESFAVRAALETAAQETQRRLEQVRVERDRERACNENLVRILTRIFGLLTPEDVRLPDGRVVRFDNPAVEREAFRALCAAIRDIPAAIASNASGNDVRDAERYSIEGIVHFSRSDPETQQCICCPKGGGHIFGRGVKWDAWQTNYPEHFGNGPDVLMYKVTDQNRHEGKRVRVTVEVLPDAAQFHSEGEAR